MVEDRKDEKKEALKVATPKARKPSPEKVASMEMAHAIKVAKFLAGGEF